VQELDLAVVARALEAHGEAPQAGEVAEIFELPLSLALDAGNYVRHDYEQDGRRGQYLSLTHQERFIWGATAAMLRLLQAALSR